MRIAVEGPRLGVGVALLVAASVATCGGARKFEHRFKLESAVGERHFGYDVSASGSRVVVGDPFDCKGDVCNGSIRILRVTGKRLVEEAKFYGEDLFAYGTVAMSGDQVATTNEYDVHIYERGRTWKLAARVPFADCGPDKPRFLALEKDTLVASSYTNICVWERNGSAWRLTSRLTDEYNVTQPVISAGVIAIDSIDHHRVQLFRRGPSGYVHAEDIHLERPTGAAISNGTLVVESKELLHVYDVRHAPREVATISAQSSEEEAGYFFGSEVALDAKTLAAAGDDGVHVYAAGTWKPMGIIRARRPHTHDRFGITLALGADVLWIGDPSTQRDEDRPREPGYVHGYARR